MGESKTQTEKEEKVENEQEEEEEEEEEQQHEEQGRGGRRRAGGKRLSRSCFTGLQGRPGEQGKVFHGGLWKGAICAQKKH